MHHNLMFPMRAVKHWDRWCEGAGIGDIARLVEEAGFDGFSMSEHPYPDREWLAHGGHHAFDPFVSLSFAAAATTRIRLMTYILVSGYRNPYLTAKAAASFDLLSGGRFTLGTGAGYLKSEFAALGADFARRGALLDEAIAAWKATWAGVDHDGPEFGVSGHVALPPPLLLGRGAAQAVAAAAAPARETLPPLAAVAGAGPTVGDAAAVVPVPGPTLPVASVAPCRARGVQPAACRAPVRRAASAAPGSADAVRGGGRDPRAGGGAGRPRGGAPPLSPAVVVRHGRQQPPQQQRRRRRHTQLRAATEACTQLRAHATARGDTAERSSSCSRAAATRRRACRRARVKGGLLEGSEGAGGGKLAVCPPRLSRARPDRADPPPPPPTPDDMQVAQPQGHMHMLGGTLHPLCPAASCLAEWSTAHFPSMTPFIAIALMFLIKRHASSGRACRGHTIGALPRVCTFIANIF